jgi:catechol 2,3-dioxygenase-like lactoylglutathione lyase family enzyme
MINGFHALLWSDDPPATRAFLRDALGLPFVDTGDGWLIFKLPPAEVGVHPTEGSGTPAGATHPWLMCDDLEATMAELADKGVEFAMGVEDQGFGLVTSIRVPGGISMGLYQPHHPVAYELEG